MVVEPRSRDRDHTVAVTFSATLDTHSSPNVIGLFVTLLYQLKKKKISIKLTIIGNIMDTGEVDFMAHKQTKPPIWIAVNRYTLLRVT